jgi:hypothetical protein
LPPRRSRTGAPGERLLSKFRKGVSGSAAGPDRAGIVLSEVAIPRKPWVVEVAATAAAPPALTVALSEAGVRTAPTPGVLGASGATGCASAVVAGTLAAAEVVATAAGAPTAHAATRAAARRVRQHLGIIHSSWIRAGRAKRAGTPPEAQASWLAQTLVVSDVPACDRT